MTRKMRDVMSPAPVCMAPAESVSAAAKAMKEHGIGVVLVVTDGRLDGLVTDRDGLPERLSCRFPVCRRATRVGEGSASAFLTR
jgi:predicted transcriptional regulator